MTCIYATPPLRTGCNTRSNFKQNKASLNSEFFSWSGCLKLKNLVFSHSLGKTDGFMPSPKHINSKWNTISSIIWIPVTDSIFDDNYYANDIYICLLPYKVKSLVLNSVSQISRFWLYIMMKIYAYRFECTTSKYLCEHTYLFR